MDDDVREACVRSIGRMLSESAEAAYEHDHPGGLPRTPDSGALADALVKCFEDDADRVRFQIATNMAVSLTGAHFLPHFPWVVGK